MIFEVFLVLELSFILLLKGPMEKVVIIPWNFVGKSVTLFDLSYPIIINLLIIGCDFLVSLCLNPIILLSIEISFA